MLSFISASDSLDRLYHKFSHRYNTPSFVIVGRKFRIFNVLRIPGLSSDKLSWDSQGMAGACGRQFTVHVDNLEKS